MDYQALETDVSENPSDRLIDRAKKFGVRLSTIHYAFKVLNIRRKKRTSLSRKRPRRTH
ncbi:MAG TPA: hypothetical protein IGS52_20260 [Oscillatoriaceae cyanobacterium M33_DOE_052]|uniref:Transposase Synechocystis PCC 6803 domain-containing protein n=1 Tax=Planktothricoides sp. SpSt-374 TaxID=2282167 RepID=A0A7C3ZUF8_9CYAN|nr:hypothetical protein [Oscillatoriaceae cyanobacterium M33_DOE_052]